MKLILPKKLLADPAKMARAITNAMNGVAKDIQVDFKVTTQTFKEQVEFVIASPSAYRRTISTVNKIYAFLNDGTPEHDIFPKPGGILRFNTPFKPKTLPNRIASGPGSKGTTEVISKRGVHHPGTEARAFDKAIQAKWEKEFGVIMQRAIDSEV
jgi:hypothetical protein